jgi:hypothetical protein
VVGPCEHSNEPLGSISMRNFSIEWLLASKGLFLVGLIGRSVNKLAINSNSKII